MSGYRQCERREFGIMFLGVEVNAFFPRPLAFCSSVRLQMSTPSKVLTPSLCKASPDMLLVKYRQLFSVFCVTEMLWRVSFGNKRVTFQGQPKPSSAAMLES